MFPLARQIQGKKFMSKHFPSNTVNPLLCYPHVLFSELYGATFHRGKTGKGTRREGEGGRGPRLFQ